MSADDATLLAQIAAGSEAAMQRFFQRHQASVYAFALRRLDNTADAADVLNDAMLQVWRGADRYAGNAKVRTWLLGIVNHKILDIYRRRQRTTHDALDENLEDEQAAHVDADIVLAQDAAMLKHCMAKLSDSHRQVVHLAFYEDMAYPAIAETLGCPAGTVKTRMLHAKKNLKRCLSALHMA
ncbi:MAG: sigma-70 family RNA polymerase sigma factor [Gammaproteobacteria bacterium]